MNLRALSDEQLQQAAWTAANAVRAAQGGTMQPANLSVLTARRDVLVNEVARRNLDMVPPNPGAATAGDTWWLFYCPPYDDPIKAALVAYKRARSSGADQKTLETLGAELDRVRAVKQAAILAATEGQRASRRA